MSFWSSILPKKPADKPATEPASAAASPAATMRAINAALRARGGAYAGYSCASVSWDDVSRGTVGGGLSCWGANITDTYLKAKDGTPLYTVRSDNWNEKLGRVSSSEVALVCGNHVAGGRAPLAPRTLRDVLKNAREHGAYAGLSVADLSDDALDRECSIRFQTTFLPVEGARGALEFATEAYNYNTRSDEDPRNLVLLCTTQGVAVQQDGAGAKRLFHHLVDDAGRTRRYWLEAERSEHLVGGAQAETAAERADALARGKATASVIGTAAMGTRFNVLMTVQVPLRQKEKPTTLPPTLPPTLGIGGGGMAWGGGGDDLLCDVMGGGGGGGGMMLCGGAPMMAMLPALDMDACGMMPQAMSMGGGMGGGMPPPPPAPAAAACWAEPESFRSAARLRRAAPAPPRRGVANAARVSRGSEHDVWPGLTARAPQRHPSERVTITVVVYNTVAGGVPSEEDVVAAVDDLERLYASCADTGRLADAPFDFMKAELTVKDALDVNAKLVTQPYAPPPAEVVGASAFPVDMD